MSAHVLGGYETGESAVWKSAKVFNSVCLFGLPISMCNHFYQCYKHNKFEAYDYGKKKNLEIYGTINPLNYLDHYHLIDIPIHFFISMNDLLIRADDIMEHYITLRKHRKDLAYIKLFEGFSHIDFTYSSHHSMISEILQTLKSFPAPSLSNT